MDCYNTMNLCSIRMMIGTWKEYPNYLQTTDDPMGPYQGQPPKEALAIQFVLMVCDGVYPAIQPMSATCGEASLLAQQNKIGNQPTKHQ